MDKVTITKSSKETQKLGQDLAKSKNIRFLALFGNLGSGKTTFAQGFAKGLGIGERIISPSFIIVRKYELENRNFYHIDLYRIENQNDIRGLGLEEIFNDPQNIVVIEWAEKMKDLLPKKRIEIYFDYLKENQRKITFKNYE